MHRELPNPTQEEIDIYMGGFGFQSTSFNLDTPIYYSTRLGLVAADAHDRNILRDHAGNLIAIDLVIGPPSPRMIKEFQSFMADPLNPF